MRLLRPSVCLLHSCLWIVVPFASSSKDEKGPGTGHGPLSAKEPAKSRREEGPRVILEDQGLLPTALHAIVLGYASGRNFWGAPGVLTELEATTN